MSVYSYVALKVHTNVQKVGTHLNVCLVYRTYVRWKYTYLFSYNNKRSIYLYITNISSSVGTRTLLYPTLFFSLLYYIYIQNKGNTLSRTLPFQQLSYFFHMFFFIIYSIYREEHTFPRLLPLFPPFPIVLLYSYYI